MNLDEEQGKLTDVTTTTVVTKSGNNGGNQSLERGVNNHNDPTTTSQTPPADWQTINTRIESEKKEIAKKAQDKFLEDLGFDSPDALKEVVASYQQMIDAQKTDQQKAEESRLKMENKLNEQAAELAIAKRALQVKEIETKILNFTEQFHIKKGAARMLAQIEAQKYQVGDEGIKDEDLRVIVKRFAEENKDLVETVKASTSPNPQQQTVKGSSVSNQPNDFLLRKLKQSRHFAGRLPLFDKNGI